MSSDNFSRYQCWRDGRIGPVINKEALAVDPAIFMATHVPFANIRYEHSPRQVPSAGEADLLRELQQNAKRNRHVFMVVLGEPGTGKSHLIRWLHERYQAEDRERGGNEEPLLIERSTGSLRGTLSQLLRLEVLQNPTLSRQLERISGATTTLSTEGVDDNLINNLQLAVTQLGVSANDLDDTIVRGVEPFLRDSLIRRHLKRDNGPIQRIRLHLTAGRRGGPLVDESIDFRADDLLIPVNERRQLRQHYDPALQELADSLAISTELREQLAGYLNTLLNFAIGKTAALSGDELKELFLDIRRELYRQKRALALFIEDITALTGLDLGLIDALITPHTSANDLCRLISVVGVTDAYYKDRFPQNIKDRATYRITLNSAEAEGGSQLLDDLEATARFAARYLNAVRLPEARLETWHSSGSDIGNLPNACLGCQFREPCHAAFGSVELEQGAGEPVQIGIYPFNRRALWTMYQNLDPRVRPTPRAFLNSILLFVLQSHGPKVKEGRFPPPAHEMGAEILAKTLPPQFQVDAIRQEAGADLERIESLLAFWGDHTARTTIQGEESRLGDLPEAVFKAFGLPFVQGVQPEDLREKAQGKKPLPPTGPKGPIVEPPAEKMPYEDEIKSWLTGQPLVPSSELAERLRGVILRFTDWERHGLSRSEAEERLKARFFFFEGQQGNVGAKTPLRYSRSTETASALLAAAAIYKEFGLDRRGLVGRNIVTLGSWLRKAEPEVVAFVSKPGRVVPGVRLVDLAVEAGLLLACIDGQLSPDEQTPDQLLGALVRSCSMGPEGEASGWNAATLQASQGRSLAWKALIERIPSQLVRACRQQVRDLLNCPQGDSNELRFVDAPRAINIISELCERSWKLPSVPKPEELASQSWDQVYAVYNELRTGFERAVDSEQQMARDALRDLNEHLADEPPAQVLRAIREVHLAMIHAQRFHQFDAKSIDEAPTIEATLKQLVAIAEATPGQAAALAVANGAPTIGAALGYQKYFVKVHTELAKIENEVANEIRVLSTDSGLAELRQDVRDLYQEVIKSVEPLADGNRSRKARP